MCDFLNFCIDETLVFYHTFKKRVELVIVGIYRYCLDNMPVYLRRVIFWLFVITFSILGPVLVLYTAGYRLDTQGGGVVRTGVISLSTAPRSVRVLLDGEDTRQKTPHVFKQLLPGDYTIRLEKIEYLSWQGDVTVESGQTVSIQNLLLFLNAPVTELFHKDIDAMSVHPTGAIVAYLTSQAGWNELWLYDLASGQHQLISQSLQIQDEQDVELLWSPQGGYLAIFEPASDPNLYTTQGDPLLIDLPALSIENIAWHPETDHLLYLNTASGLEQYDLITNRGESIEQTDATSIQLDASILSFYDNGTHTEVQQLIDNKKEVLALLPRETYELKERDGNYLLLENSKSLITLLEIHSKNPILIERKAISFDWLANQDLLVYSDGSEVNIYNAHTGETTFLTRQSLPIESVLWHPIGQHVIVQDTADIQTYEYQPLAKERHVTTLLDDIDVERWWLSDGGQTMYLYGTRGGANGFFKRELMKDTLGLEL